MFRRFRQRALRRIRLCRRYAMPFTALITLLHVYAMLMLVADVSGSIYCHFRWHNTAAFIFADADAVSLTRFSPLRHDAALRQRRCCAIADIITLDIISPCYAMLLPIFSRFRAAFV